MPVDRSLAMLLTAPQPAAIAVVRLSGSLISTFAAAHLSKPPQIGRCIHCDLREGDNTLDDIIAVLAEPDRLDLNLHGGPWVIEAALRLAERAGFEIVPWQDAPAIAADAKTEINVEIAAALPFAATREALSILLAQSAAWADMLASDDATARRRALSDRTIEYILCPPTVAIIGEPNAGKSTLLNRLAGQARSITADVPGTTRDYVTTPANLAGLAVQLIDTPGHRETTDLIEAQAIASAQAVIATAQVVIELRDATNLPLVAPRAGAIVVYNKCDRSKPPTDGLPISATTGAGIDALITAVLNRLSADDLTSPHARAWTARQKQFLSLSLGLC